MICEFKWPGVSFSAAFRESDWAVGSTSGVTGSFEPFAEGPSIEAGVLNIPMHRTGASSVIVETSTLTGDGLGIGASGGLQVPWVDFRNLNAPLKNAPVGG